MQRSQHLRRYRSHHGLVPRQAAVTVELAVTIPILFLLLFASIEFCGYNVMRHSVDNAAYEAARRGIVPGATVTDVQDTANAIMRMVGARNVTVDVVPSTIDNDTDEITVSVTLPVADNGWITPIIFRATDIHRGQCRLVREDY